MHFLGCLGAPAEVYRWSPVIGTDDVPGQPIELIQKGEFNAMPLIVGNTRDEGLMFIYMGVEKPVPRWELDIAITAIFGVNALKGVCVLKRFFAPLGPPVPCLCPVIESRCPSFSVHTLACICRCVCVCEFESV